MWVLDARTDWNCCLGNGSRPSPFVVFSPTPCRALSGKTMRHGREVVQWGYTDAQIRSLRQLVNGLIRALPGVPAQLARGPGGTIQQLLPKHGQGFRGVVGHAQLSKKATDPSVALDWDVLRIP